MHCLTQHASIKTVTEAVTILNSAMLAQVVVQATWRANYQRSSPKLASVKCRI